MARKFKKKLARKVITKKTPVLSINIIGKERVEKIKVLYHKIHKLLINKTIAG